MTVISDRKSSRIFLRNVSTLTWQPCRLWDAFLELATSGWPVCTVVLVHHRQTHSNYLGVFSWIQHFMKYFPTLSMFSAGGTMIQVPTASESFTPFFFHSNEAKIAHHAKWEREVAFEIVFQAWWELLWVCIDWKAVLIKNPNPHQDKQFCFWKKIVGARISLWFILVSV